MRLSLLILGNPHNSDGPRTALHFARAALTSGHSIYRVFFYHEGVVAGSDLPIVAQDAENIPESWQTLILENKLDAVVCIASAIRRGVFNASEAQRHGQTGGSLRAGFDLSGLGQLVDAIAQSDRVVTFGA